MSLSHELPVLVAPRPVRIASAFAFARRVHNSSPSRVDSDNASDHSSQSPSPLGGRSSTLPSEAIEEFLSILKPSFFPSTSPTLGKARRALTIPTFHQYERQALALRPQRQRIENAPIPKSEDASDHRPFTPTSPNLVGGEPQDSFTDHYEQEAPASRWLHFGPLSSPISRIHTRNPFSKQVPDQLIYARPLSPAAIPLPTPTPEEWQMLQEV